MASPVDVCSVVKELLSHSPREDLRGIPSGRNIWHVTKRTGELYHCFAAFNNRKAVRLFTSNDGTSFDEHPNSPVLKVGERGKWDDLHIEPHSLVEARGGWRLYYGGAHPKTAWESAKVYLSFLGNRNLMNLVHLRSFTWKVGFAESQDLLAWSKHYEPVFECEGNHAADPKVIHVPDRFLLYFVRSEGGGYAADSPDGTNWKVLPKSPLIPGNLSQVVRIDDAYFALYINREGLNLSFGSDCVSWTRYSGNPVLAGPPTSSSSTQSITWSSLVQTPDSFRLYYVVKDNDGLRRIAMRTIASREFYERTGATGCECL